MKKEAKTAAVKDKELQDAINDATADHKPEENPVQTENPAENPPKEEKSEPRTQPGGIPDDRPAPKKSDKKKADEPEVRFDDHLDGVPHSAALIYKDEEGGVIRRALLHWRYGREADVRDPAHLTLTHAEHITLAEIGHIVEELHKCNHLDALSEDVFDEPLGEALDPIDMEGPAEVQ